MSVLLGGQHSPALCFPSS